jgi:hypothetical protein
VENVLPLLREQITTTDGYVSHVSQVKEQFFSFCLSTFLLNYEIAINGISNKFTFIRKICYILYEYNSID